MTTKTAHHQIAIIGAGNAGISVAARLKNAGETDIAIIDPAKVHYYQPLWTLVGGGCADAKKSARPQQSVIPKGVRWIQAAAQEVDPEQRSIKLSDNSNVTYNYLVVAPGIQLDWHKLPGLTDTLGKNNVSSNYSYELAPKTWEFIQNTRSGTAVFGQPSGPIKCAGAPQKIAYLAADYWRQQGVLDDIDIQLVLPTPTIFGVPTFAKALEEVAAGYGIKVRYNSEITQLDGPNRTATITDNSAGTTETLGFDVLHTAPAQSAPDWIKESPLADPNNPFGYVEVDKHTLQHTRYPEIFSLGDASNTPNSKTGAAIRKQAPVLVENLLAAKKSHGKQPLAGVYNGYGACPLTTSRSKMLLAEFDYDLNLQPFSKYIDTTRPRRDMWYLKKYGLPALYWNAILKGRD